jgi:hypothetical protein
MATSENIRDRIRKEIQLPKDILKDLKIVAAYSDKSVKKYMEDLIIQDVKAKSLRLAKNSNHNKRNGNVSS